MGHSCFNAASQGLFCMKVQLKYVLKPFLLDEFSFVKDVISTCFKSSRWPTAQKFVQKLGKKRLRENVTTFLTGWLRALEKKFGMGLYWILSVHELHGQFKKILSNFPALWPIKRWNNSGCPSPHLLVWSILDHTADKRKHWIMCNDRIYSIIQTPAHRSVFLEVLWIIWADHTPV